MTEEPVQFPQYPAPGPTMISRDQAKPLQKVISRMFKPKMRMRKKGLHSSSDIHITAKKVKFY